MHSPRPSSRTSRPSRRPNGAKQPTRQPSGPRLTSDELFATFSTGAEPNLNASFAELGVPEPLIRELTRQGIERPFPIQAATMVDCIAGGDVLGRGRTGSGKTLAFALPVLTRLANSGHQRRPGRPRAMILVPTRELAVQIETVMRPLGNTLGLKVTTVFGGVGPMPQIKALRMGVDVVIACPGRLLDHMESGYVGFDACEITVLDEADHMADMGFLPGVKRLLDRTPQHSQRLLFSATLDNGIDAIVRQYLVNPTLRSVDPVESVEEKMTHHVLAVSNDDRFGVLRSLSASPGRVIVFTRTKHGAKRLTKQLVMGGVPAVEMHGNLSQNVRVRNLELLRSGGCSVMVATDVAARGIHVDDINLVVHFDPPVDHKAYLHRSGRTARAGAEGVVVTMMSEGQGAEVKDLAKKAGISPTITRVTEDHPLLAEIAPGERTFVTPPPMTNAPAQPSGRPPRGASRTSILNSRPAPRADAGRTDTRGTSQPTTRRSRSAAAGGATASQPTRQWTNRPAAAPGAPATRSSLPAGPRSEGPRRSGRPASRSSQGRW